MRDVRLLAAEPTKLALRNEFLIPNSQFLIVLIALATTKGGVCRLSSDRAPTGTAA